MKIILIISLFSTALMLSAQEVNLSIEEDSLVKLLKNLRNAKNNQEKKEANLIFKTKFKSVLQNKEALTYPFSQLTTVGVINSPDRLMRIINWNIEQDDFSQKYTCFILHFDKRKKKYHVTELKDISFGMPTQPTEILTSDNWYGALYYKIIPVKKGSRTLYTVLGWDYYSDMSQMKLIDVIYFSGNIVKIGSPIFKLGKTTLKRVFFEHSKKTGMSLRYEEERERIIFDHLSPETPSMKNFRSFYVPDLSYDAFIFAKGKWILHEDVIGVNKESNQKKQTVFVMNPKTGKVEEVEMKTEWEDPSDSNAPVSGNEHVAVTPESDSEENIKKKNNLPKVNKRDKRDPSNPSFYNDIKKKKKKNRKIRK